MYRMTATYEIWDDDDGETHLEVGEDAEGLDQVEIREHYNEDITAVCCTPEQAQDLILAIQAYLDDPQRNIQVVSDEETRLEVGKPDKEPPSEGPESDEEPETEDEDFVEIRECDDQGEVTGSICFTLEQAIYVKNAIHRYLKAREFLEKNPTGAVPST